MDLVGDTRVADQITIALKILNKNITFFDKGCDSMSTKRLQIIGSLNRTNARIAHVDLLAANWVGMKSPYSQAVEIEGITENSQVDLTPSIEQLIIFYEKDLGFVTENEDGVVTVYAIGQKPENDYTIQVTITEVEA